MRRFALVAAGVAAAFVLTGVVLAAVVGDVASVVPGLSYLTFPVVAVVVTRRWPRHPVAWCFVASSFLLGVEKTGQEATTLGLRDGWSAGVVHLAAWAMSWPWFPGLFLLVTVALLRFPDGRLPGPRWRWAERLALASMLVWTVCLGSVTWSVSTAELTSDETPHAPGLAGVVLTAGLAMFFPVAVATVASLVSLVVRYRHSDSVGREQARWVLFAAAIAITVETVLDLYGSFGPTDLPAWVQSIGEGGSFAFIGVATAVAITRYKLFEIERIVSRTLAYALVLVALVAIYLTVVLGLAALVPADLGQVGVALATLVVSVVAVPLTRRVRRVVDRRFNRARFDAERVVTGFAARLRSAPDRDDVSAQLLDVLGRTVQPSHAAVWTVSR